MLVQCACKNFRLKEIFLMNGQELFTKISEMLEKFGIKEALKNPQVVETIYDVMSKHGMKVDKNLFNIVVMGFAVTPTDKLGSLIGMLTGAMSATQGATNQQGGAAANPLAAILGGLAAAQQPQQNAQAQGAAANPLAAILTGLAGAAAANQPQQNAQPQQQSTGNPTADLVGGILSAALNQNRK